MRFLLAVARTKLTFRALGASVVGLLVVVAGLIIPATVAAAPVNQAITVRNFNYSPASFTTHVGDQVTLNITNAGPAPHTFTITGVTDSGQIAPGTSKQVTFTVSQAGTLTFFCTIHGASVMSGQISVQPASAAPVSPNTAPQTQPPAPQPIQPAVPAMRPPQTGDAGLLARLPAAHIAELLDW